MRPVIRGAAPKTYNQYSEALPDLLDRLGVFCSYCEMNVSNSPEVEHVVPINHGGAPLDWNNLLISCKQCNINKSDNNLNRANYVWPDEDNTLKAIEYFPPFCLGPNPNLNTNESLLTVNTIELCQLNKWPGGNVEPTFKDLRWKHRGEAWFTAEDCLNDFQQNPSPQHAASIARLVCTSSFFSVYFEVFKNEPLLINALIAASTGIDPNCFGANSTLVAKGKIS